MRIESLSPQQTARAGALFLEKIKQSPRTTRARLILLEGELGAGKTTFVRGVCRAFGIRSYVTSPTFVLVQTYPVPKTGEMFHTVAHGDAYRLTQDNQGIIRRYLASLLLDPGIIVFLEWSRHMALSVPARRSVRFFVKDPNQRIITWR